MQWTTAALSGAQAVTACKHVLARLIHHEIDYLDGLLYVTSMQAVAAPMPVEKYWQTGQA